MTVIIPLAGYGTRLRPFTYQTPKPLLQVAGNTVLGWIFKSLSSIPLSRMILVIGYKGEEIKEWVRVNYPDINIDWVLQEESRGLGHAVWMAGREISLDDDVIIYLGDTIFDVDWSKMEEKNKNYIAVDEVENPARFGILKIEGGKIIDLIEKPEDPPSNLAVIGLYYLKEWRLLFPHLDRIISMNIKSRGEYQLTDALRIMLKKKNFSLEKLSIDGWFDCGTKKSLIKSNAELLSRFVDKEYKSEWIKEPCFLIKDSIEANNSQVGPFVSIGRNTIIKNSKVVNSIVGEGAKIINSRIHNSIIGDRVRVKDLAGVFYLVSDSFVLGKEDE